MFERFTVQARQVITLAQEEARALDHDYIGTEHLLLSLTRDDGSVAARALASLGISREAIRQQAAKITGRKAPAGPIPFTAITKRAIELSVREALQLGRNYVAAEHLLLSITHEGRGGAAWVLAGLQADRGQLRRQVIGLLGDRERSRPAPPSPPPGPSAAAEA